MAEKKVTALPPRAGKVPDTWNSSAGFWFEDYEQQKKEMQKTVLQIVKEAFEEACRSVNTGLAPFIKRKSLLNFHGYLYRQELPMSLRLAYSDLPLSFHKKGPVFMEIEDGILVLRFPEMKEMVLFVEELNMELRSIGVVLDLMEEADDVYYQLCAEANLDIR